MQYVIFVVMTGILIAVMAAGFRRTLENRKKPRLTVSAVVLCKQKASHSSMHEGGTSSYTTYHAAFRTDSGEELHFEVKGLLYRKLRDGDRGQLTYQGTRFISFEKES